jgi:hypothetical protein
MNVCGHPNVSQIRSHVSKLGERAGLDLLVLTNAHAEKANAA